MCIRDRFWKPAPKLEGQLKDEAVYPWYIRVSGVSAALLPNVAGAGHTVFELSLIHILVLAKM